MKKTLGILTLASTFLFGANNLLTIVEQNSLTKMGKYNIKSYANPNNAMEISKGIENTYFHNFSPYAYTEIDGYENDLNVIVMVGEKTIQYGSIYSKGFGEKYNINTLVNLIKKRDLAAALNTLDTFQQNNLIYIRNKVSIINNNDLEILKNYINTEVSEDRRYSYLKKIEVIYSLVDYANLIYSYTRSNLELDPVNNVFFDINSGFSASSKTVTIDNIVNCHNIIFSASTIVPTLTQIGTQTLNIYGSSEWQVGMGMINVAKIYSFVV